MSTDTPLIIFDWDGTLMDSEARIVSCLQSAFSAVHLPPPTRAAVRDIIGLALAEAITHLLPTAPESVRAQIFAHFRHHYLVADTTPTQLFPGALDLLNDLNARGYLLAVATGKGRRGLDQALAETGCAKFFAYTRCADESRSKPHPQMLLDIFARLGCTPECSLMIGDTEYDMLMAQATGTRALAVSYGSHPRERLLLHPVLACVDSMAELQQWFTHEFMRLKLETPEP